MASLNRIHSRETMANLFRAVSLDPRAGWVDSLCRRVSTNQLTEEYVDLGMVPSMTPWVGGRKPKYLREETFTITNQKYEASIIIPRDDLILEKSEMVQGRINSLAERAGTQHWKKLLTTLIEAGESAVAFDGQYYFDTDHVSAASGSQSNDLTNNITTTTAPTVDEITTSIVSAIVAILGFKDDQGEQMNDGLSDFLVMVPLSYLVAAKLAVNANLIGYGRTNELQALSDEFRVTVVGNSRSTWTTKLAVFANNASAKPLITQQLEDVRVSAKAEGSDFEYDNDAHEYGVSAYRAVGYGAWSSACLVTHT